MINKVKEKLQKIRDESEKLEAYILKNSTRLNKPDFDSAAYFISNNMLTKYRYQEQILKELVEEANNE